MIVRILQKKTERERGHGQSYFMYKKDSVLTGITFAKSDLEPIFIQMNIFYVILFKISKVGLNNTFMS